MARGGGDDSSWEKAGGTGGGGGSWGTTGGREASGGLGGWRAAESGGAAGGGAAGESTVGGKLGNEVGASTVVEGKGAEGRDVKDRGAEDGKDSMIGKIFGKIHAEDTDNKERVTSIAGGSITNSKMYDTTLHGLRTFTQILGSIRKPRAS